MEAVELPEGQADLTIALGSLVLVASRSKPAPDVLVQYSLARAASPRNRMRTAAGTANAIPSGSKR